MLEKKWPFRKVKEEQAQFIVDQYLQKKGTKAIGKMLDVPVSSKTILDVLLFMEVPIRKTRSTGRRDEKGNFIHDYPRWIFTTVTPQDAQKAKVLYLSGKNVSEVCEVVGNSVTTITRVLRGLGVDLRDTKDRCMDIDAKAFTDINDDETAYWYGWLLSDGCMSPTQLGTPTISIALKREDRAVLENYCSYIRLPPARVKDYEFYVHTVDKHYSMSVVKFSNHHISETLYGLGMRPRKSMNEVVPKCFLFNRHFWRGVIEGDGYISNPSSVRPQAKVHLVGSQSLCEDFKRYCESMAVRVRVYPQVKESGKILYATYSGGKDNVKKLMDSLYQDVPEHMRLKRKYERYLGWFYPELLK